MGSVISKHHLNRIEGMLARRGGGTIIAGGERLTGKSSLDGFDFSKGSFLPPTVITDVHTEDELWKEEVFGPVVVVKRFSVSDQSIVFILAIKKVTNNCLRLDRKSEKVLPWLMPQNMASGQVYGLQIYLEHIV